MPSLPSKFLCSLDGLRRSWPSHSSSCNSTLSLQTSNRFRSESASLIFMVLSNPSLLFHQCFLCPLCPTLPIPHVDGCQIFPREGPVLTAHGLANASKAKHGKTRDESRQERATHHTNSRACRITQCQRLLLVIKLCL